MGLIAFVRVSSHFIDACRIAHLHFCTVSLYINSMASLIIDGNDYGTGS